jgi:hypothetical protein
MENEIKVNENKILAIDINKTKNHSLLDEYNQFKDVEKQIIDLVLKKPGITGKEIANTLNISIVWAYEVKNKKHVRKFISKVQLEYTLDSTISNYLKSNDVINNLMDSENEITRFKAAQEARERFSEAFKQKITSQNNNIINDTEYDNEFSSDVKIQV